MRKELTMEGVKEILLKGWQIVAVANNGKVEIENNSIEVAILSKDGLLTSYYSHIKL